MVIASYEVKQVINEVFQDNKSKKLTKKDLCEVISIIFARSGIDVSDKVPKRQGVIGEKNSNMMLICSEPDGYKLIPLKPGMSMELAFDGSWHPVKVIANDNESGLKQKLDGIDYDDVPVLGAYARMVLSLSGNGKALQLEESKKQIEKGNIKNEQK